MRIINIVFTSLMLTACVAPVNIDYDKNTRFDSFTTYSVQNKPVRVSADTRVNSSFMQQRVINEVKEALTKKVLKM